MNHRGIPALFLDRDGVINEEIGYLSRSEQVRWVPGIFSLVRTAQARGYRVVVVTNQAGIARGLYTTEEFETLMDWMRERFLAEGCALDAVYHCPFHPVHGLGSWKQDHVDRKPSPGMLWRAAKDLGLDLAQSVLVGDRCSDIAAARAAGLRQAFLKRGTEPASCPDDAILIDTLAEVQAWLESQPEPR